MFVLNLLIESIHFLVHQAYIFNFSNWIVLGNSTIS